MPRCTRHSTAAAPGLEYAEIRFDIRGQATVLMGTKNQGQGHETTFKQVVGSQLGLTPGEINYVDGDTDRVAFGIGTFGSRSGATGGSKNCGTCGTGGCGLNATAPPHRLRLD